jgi:hypothetical protein
MNATAISGGAISFYAALSSFAMEFGVVPMGLEEDSFVFGSIDEPQADLQPLIHTDGTWEDPARISGFPRISERVGGPNGSFDDNDLCGFHRDWLHMSGMMDAPVSALVYGLPYEAEGKINVPKGYVPEKDYKWNEISEVVLEAREAKEPSLKGLEFLTVRDVLSMLNEGTADIERVGGISDFMYMTGMLENDGTIAGRLLFAAGMLFASLGMKEKAATSLRRTALRLPIDHVSGKAMLYEIATNLKEDERGRRAVAKRWMQAVSRDRDAGTRNLKIIHAMWNAWRAGDLTLMRKIIELSVVKNFKGKDSMEVARNCVRLAWLESERIRRDKGDETQNPAKTGLYTYLDIAASLFMRVGDEKSAARAAELADMLVTRKKGNRVA